MIDLIGKGFSIVTENTRTVTSGNATGTEYWVVNSIIDQETVYCELKDTNMSMYSGGYFREFKVKNIKF